ncbi:hypothetical protein BRC81_05595 [Halobacteriales archaeon QS_1_68_20]|nr:MAG: hypothetical protein BRC81_05595 [Halobacteriales archaeon QS_1_68_20]
MEVREAVEDDAESLASITGAPVDAMRTIIHDRTVRVAVDGGDEERILGVVSFDARPEVVHVTQLDGDRAACERLLEEPVAFARNEGMAVEVLVPESESSVQEVAEAAGFERAGSGPRFEGKPTVRYRLDA